VIKDIPSTSKNKVGRLSEREEDANEGGGHEDHQAGEEPRSEAFEVVFGLIRQSGRKGISFAFIAHRSTGRLKTYLEGEERQGDEDSAGDGNGLEDDATWSRKTLYVSSLHKLKQKRRTE
jgi:hypothetical protein